jgi:hypothetical protein
MAEERIAERIDANLLNVTMQELHTMTKDEYDRKFDVLRTKTHGKLIIKEYPTAAASSLHFRSLLNELHLKKNFQPHIIFIDYVNICSSARIKPGANVGGEKNIEKVFPKSKDKTKTSPLDYVESSYKKISDEQTKRNEEAIKKRKEQKDVLKKIEDQERKDLYADEIVVNEELDAIDTEWYEKGLEREQEQTQALLDGMKVIQEEELDAQIKALNDERIIAQTKDEVRQASIANAIGGLNTLAALDKDNKTLQAAALVAGNVAAIAQTVQSTTIANAKAVAAFPVTFGQPWVGINTISAGIGIAASIAATAKGLSALGAGGNAGSKPVLPSGGGGSAPAAPNINQATLFPTQQLEGAETETVSTGGPGQRQQVIKAVVSERDVTNVQNRISNYERMSEIG